MPTTKIRKDAREGKGTVKSLEKKWDRAEDIAKGKGAGGNDWPLTMHIYQNMTKGGTAMSASTRIKAARQLIKADAFEGWVNSLQYKYERPEGANYVIVDAPKKAVKTKLDQDGWATARRADKTQLSKGEHSVVLEEMGAGKTKIIDGE